MFNNFLNRKRSKYGNKKIVHEGEKFDSKKEFARWLVLKEAEENGIITDLKRQVRFELLPPVREEYVVHLKTKDVTKTRVVQQAVFYVSDFAYFKDGVFIVEDIKSKPTSLDKSYTLKKKMMRSLKDICIKEIFDPNTPI